MIKHIAPALTAMLAAMLQLALTGAERDADYPPVNVKEYADRLRQDNNLPFNKIWIDYLNLKKYNKIIIAEVAFGRGGPDQAEALRKSAARKLSARDEQQLKDFARQTREAFQLATQNNVDFDLVAQPGPKTLILQLYLVYVATATPLLDTAKHDAGAASTVPAVAIEGVLADSQDGRVALVFADRQALKIAAGAPALPATTVYDGLRRIANEWAALFVKTLNSQQGEVITRPSSIGGISLQPTD